MHGKLIVCGVALVLMTGCASVEESAVYKPEEMNRLENYRLVKVVHTEQVTIDPETPGIVGAGVGATSGGLIGSQVGGDSAVVALAVLGGLIGYAVEQQATDTTATRYVINDNGNQKIIVQKDSDEPIQPGETAMMIGEYEPRLVRAPQEIIDAAQQNGGAGGVKVNEETGVITFDQDLGASEAPQGSDPGGATWEQNGGSGWVEPTGQNWGESQDQQ